MKNPVNILKSLNFALNMGELHKYLNFISMTTSYKQKHSIHWCIKIDLGTFFNISNLCIRKTYVG